MNRLSVLLSGVMMIVLLAGCSSVRVTSDFDSRVDFSRLHTYAWDQRQDGEDVLAANPLLYKRIVAAVDHHLASRGYRLVDVGQADILLTIRGVSREKMRVTNRPVHAPYGRYPYSYAWGHPGYENRIDVSYYTEGTLVIDMYSNRTGEMIWRGVGSGILGKNMDRAGEDQAIDLYVSKILEQFPPGSGAQGSTGKSGSNKD